MPPLCGGACASSKQAKFKRGLSGNGAALAAVGPQLPRNSVSALRQRVIGKTGLFEAGVPPSRSSSTGLRCASRRPSGQVSSSRSKSYNGASHFPRSLSWVSHARSPDEGAELTAPLMRSDKRSQTIGMVSKYRFVTLPLLQIGPI